MCFKPHMLASRSCYRLQSCSDVTCSRCCKTVSARQGHVVGSTWLWIAIDSGNRVWQISGTGWCIDHCLTPGFFLVHTPQGFRFAVDVLRTRAPSGRALKCTGCDVGSKDAQVRNKCTWERSLRCQSTMFPRTGVTCRREVLRFTAARQWHCPTLRMHGTWCAP